MIESIRLKRKEESPVSIGDVVQYHGGTFVIINILGIDVKSFRENDNNIFFIASDNFMVLQIWLQII
ncbi:MAG TPA: hypothetical protein K8V00_02090 [Ligilactobacillus acidipiscis]|uniref:Uncharacterized protein n=1 Tax=Ligilactobacillus acidipiscis TaxID=89059 RepID=A0A921F918_9LACO|nr:hypothetical protein [Ligilactobacillus acidipiscis]